MAGITAVDAIRSRMPWVGTGCPPGVGGPGLELCIRYRGDVLRAGVCLDDRPVPLALLDAYATEEIYAIDYIGGPRPQVRLYTELFLESGRPVRPIAFGCH